MEDLIVEFFASFFIYFLFVGLIILWFIDGKIKKEQVLHAIFAVLVAYFACVVVKHFFPTVRPFMIDGRGVDVFIKPTWSGSFPSEHTAIAFALSVTVFLHDRKIGWWFLISSSLIGVARVFANVHYPLDIIGGAFLGTIVAVVVEKSHFNIINYGNKRKN